ncbi:MAG: hypothetical protein GFH27_549283n197 [Chloroflexi bacterium AL-W]|nr:hypothetical protein [Chloroflexi bacterium AL-N1]NOK64682.1 hypothetical protein [Chloroflexi bacterium AL-N10]NOK75923.1 hypothetical protein [Chloroflexi bacterium AL-N5]NOK80318.1 hypothetical protein [Chloroflexi bacterium AL-W]NOK86831.1 hypothetical protein [Chloroflexi bacterium AL-N15]
MSQFERTTHPKRTTASRTPGAPIIERLRLVLDLPLLLVLLVGLVIRVLLWDSLPRTGFISDEGEYLSAAHWLAQGRGFTWYLGYLWTRAPVYPLFIAVHLRIFGDTLTPIYATQTLLSLINVALVYYLARQLSQQRAVPTIAALLMACYLPFATYPQILLSETLYITLLLSGFLALAFAQKDETNHTSGTRYDWRFLIIAGGIFGLATLTRSLTLLFLPLVAAWLCWPHKTTWRTWSFLRPALAFLISAVCIITPWTLYNSRVYGGLVLVDTTGAFNLLLGAKTAAEGGRNDASTRNYVLNLISEQAPPFATDTCLGQTDIDPLPTQAARQGAMMSEGLCLIMDNPIAFTTKSFGELVDLFQINYTGSERFTGGFTTGRLPIWYASSLFLLDDTLYVLTLPLAVIGWALAWRTLTGPPRALVALIGLWWLYNIVVAPMLFAINRFRLPLLPFAFIIAAFAMVALARGIRWERRLLPWVAMAITLCVIATAPYAYLWPRNEALTSYFGFHPSSLNSTWLALTSRPIQHNTEAFRQALHADDRTTAQALLDDGLLTNQTRQLGPALLNAHNDLPNEGLDALAQTFNQTTSRLPETFAVTKNVAAAVLYGDLQRSLGNVDEARFTLGETFIDDANPVQWAWDWLDPVPTRSIDLAGDLDLGYIAGCYLGEGDTSIEPPVTFRWCTDGAQLRFPAAGSGTTQVLELHVDGRGWRAYASEAPATQVLLDDELVGTFSANGVETVMVTLPPTPAGEDVVVTLRTPTFIPEAADYLNQQGALAEQPRQLGVRIDRAELREVSP